MRTPEFWRTNGWLPALLTPVGFFYGVAGRFRQRQCGTTIGVPVLCIGNVVAGGAGKTPVALRIAQLLQARGKRVAFLSRGYGGKEHGPTCVDLSFHTASDVGDEPLLLAALAPTYVGRDRVAAARLAVAAGAEVLIMDDGFQNPSLKKTCSLLVVDGGFGFGNGKLLPAGPLRERPQNAFQRADAMVIVGVRNSEFPTGELPVFHAELQTRPVTFDRERHVFAFAGIGRPEKFFRSVADAGLQVTGTQAFPDHHGYRERELQDIAFQAKAHEAILLTTRKDWVRLPPAWRERVQVLDVDAVFKEEKTLIECVNQKLASLGNLSI